ncbi:L-rhamnose isomerase [Jiangella sp. DSM 45060]|uniref:L-rhamnose isomerase n=1 Tax=Jiangella sp. DSM 45060 TaxID=1798224 RepID=UPI000879B6BC|nr:L-rhamnose isomerase [Jiangella sp. DSM 45060]SDS55401.1 L-rhamnose isomerase / sugar isomerase [Jiangella sp. DSM 45060]
MTDAEHIVDRLSRQHIETQSWGYVSTGTRFKVYDTPGTARDVREKIDDAALVHRLTGVAPTVALHIPWDRVDDYAELARYAQDQGVRIGSISPNLFQDDAYRLGSLTNEDATVRKQAVAHVRECAAILREVGSDRLSMWVADGTNYPGQGNFRRRRRHLEDGLREAYEALPEQAEMILEYKFFEPAFYHTDIADWGQSLTLCETLGERARVLVDIGHHALGVNIEHIVATLLDRGRLGGFDLNSKKYGDDDLFVGAINPQETFLIALELVSAEDDADEAVAAGARSILYKIDQCAMIEDKIPAMIRSVTAMQTAFAKALLVDRDELDRRRAEGDVVGANEVVNDAFETDVRPLLARVRERLGVPADPLGAYRASGEQERRNAERVGTPAGW